MNSKTKNTSILVLWPRYLSSQEHLFRSFLKKNDLFLIFIATWKIPNAYNESKFGFQKIGSDKVNQWNFTEIRLGKLGIYKSFLMFCKIFFTILRIKPKVIITSTQFPLHSRLAFIISKILKIKIAFYTEAWEFPIHKRVIKRISHKLTRLTEKSADYILTQSDHKKGIYQSLGIKEEKIIVLPFLVNNYSENKIKTITKPKKILYLGRFIEQKGIDLLLSAFINLSQDNEEIELILAGDTKEKLISISKKNEELMNLVQLKGLNERISFVGFLDQESKKKIFESADIFVMPSRFNEGWGISLVEAAQFGMILLASDKVAAGKVFIRENVNGFIFQTESENQLIEKLRNAINLTEETTFQFSRNSINIFEEYNNEKHFIDTLNSLVK